MKEEKNRRDKKHARSFGIVYFEILMTLLLHNSILFTAIGLVVRDTRLGRLSFFNII